MHFTVFVPFAARWPIEVHMLPHRHVPDLAATTPGERGEIAVLYRRVLSALDRLYDDVLRHVGGHLEPEAAAARLRAALDGLD